MLRKSMIIMGMLCLLPGLVWAQSSTNYTITGGNLNSGGRADMVSTSYSASTTIGQSSPIGERVGMAYTLQSGVQYIYDECQQDTPQFNYLLWTK